MFKCIKCGTPGFAFCPDCKQKENKTDIIQQVKDLVEPKPQQPKQETEQQPQTPQQISSQIKKKQTPTQQTDKPKTNKPQTEQITEQSTEETITINVSACVPLYTKYQLNKQKNINYYSIQKGKGVLPYKNKFILQEDIIKAITI